jgi:iron complex transport system substrate-binding protein
MRRVSMVMSLCLGVLLAAIGAVAPAGARTVVDSAGRHVEVSDTVRRVWPAGPPAAALLYMLAPEKLAGWARPLSPGAKEFIDPRAAALPVLGRLTGRGNTAKLETVMKAAPDLILDVGTVRPSYVSLADRIEAQTHIPYVLIGGTLADAPELLAKTGAVLGVMARAQALADYATATLRAIKAGIATVPEDHRPKIYVARGPRGLETDVAGSLNAEAFAFLGARNVVASGRGAGNLADVSMEQVLAWQPAVIVTIDRDFFKAVWKDPAWQGVKAVRDKRVYLEPLEPFGWVDEPPGPNRLIGLRWLAKLLYPQRFPEDLRAETKRFYELFYHQTPSDAQLDRLLAPR